MDRNLGGWTDGWKNILMDGWMDGRPEIDIWIDEWMKR